LILFGAKLIPKSIAVYQGLLLHSSPCYVPITTKMSNEGKKLDFQLVLPTRIHLRHQVERRFLQQPKKSRTKYLN